MSRVTFDEESTSVSSFKHRTSGITQFVMDCSSGLIKNKSQAEAVLLVGVILIASIAIAFSFLINSSKGNDVPPEQLRQYILEMNARRSY